MSDNLIVGGIFLTLFVVIISKCVYNEYNINKENLRLEKERERITRTEELDYAFSNLENLPPPYEDVLIEDGLKVSQ